MATKVTSIDCVVSNHCADDALQLARVVTCTFTVTVRDTELPTITCPENFDIGNDAGTCGAMVSYEVPVGVDNCPESETLQTAGQDQSSAFPVGASGIRYSVTDRAGNTGMCIIGQV
jgi:hypothetical protein